MVYKERKLTISYTAHTQTDFQRLRVIHTKQNNLSVDGIFSGSLNRNELRVNQLKQKHVPIRIESAVMNQSSQVSLVLCLVKQYLFPHIHKIPLSVLLLDFGVCELSYPSRKIDREIDIVQQSFSFSFQCVQFYENQCKTTSAKNASQ